MEIKGYILNVTQQELEAMELLVKMIGHTNKLEREKISKQFSESCSIFYDLFYLSFQKK